MGSSCLRITVESPRRRALLLKICSRAWQPEAARVIRFVRQFWPKHIDDPVFQFTSSNRNARISAALSRRAPSSQHGEIALAGDVQFARSPGFVFTGPRKCTGGFSMRGPRANQQHPDPDAATSTARKRKNDSGSRKLCERPPRLALRFALQTHEIGDGCPVHGLARVRAVTKSRPPLNAPKIPQLLPVAAAGIRNPPQKARLRTSTARSTPDCAPRRPKTTPRRGEAFLASDDAGHIGPFVLGLYTSRQTERPANQFSSDRCCAGRINIKRLLQLQYVLLSPQRCHPLRQRRTTPFSFCAIANVVGYISTTRIHSIASVLSGVSYT